MKIRGQLYDNYMSNTNYKELRRSERNFSL